MKLASTKAFETVSESYADKLVRADTEIKVTSIMMLKKTASRAPGGDPLFKRGLNIQLNENAD